ncbi:MAG: DNA polymerase IV [Clostridiales bacterium]|jgi:DNA polymerase-4|nr:DNA polymerase IV [Clostridiales bacterium]MBP3809820.1 DNA polymerase IV [Clostridiales bacterium]MBR4495079.1 DNA polymerase IV [Clostridiales bacterium]
MRRTIFHIDQNCFFASVEMIAHPEYRNVPMAVTGDATKRHGIILARNEPAKQAGVKTAEAIWQAEQKCPGLVKVSSHYDKYAFYSGRLRAMYEEYSDRVEPFGMDECWVDLTDVIGDRDPKELADEIRRRVRDEFKLSCSIGVSFNKIFAKLGSDYKKPDATTVITEENFREVVWPLPAADLLFVGGATANKLTEVNIRTIGDIANTPREFMSDYLGKPGDSLWLYANGIDDSPVAPADAERQYKSIGNSMTTPRDIMNRTQACGTFHTLAASVASRLRKHGLLGCNVAITVRDRDLITYEHQRTLFEPTNSEKVIYETAMDLFDESYDWHTAIRSVGVRCAKVIPEDSGVQMSMFSESQEKREEDSKLNKVIDDINRRFGDGTIKSCASMQGIMSPNYNPEFYDGGITEGKKDPFK